MNERIKRESNLFTLSAVVVGFLLLQELDAKQQNDLGNWFMLVGQVLCTNAANLAILSPSDNNSDTSKEEVISTLEKTVAAMQKEIQELKKSQ